MAGKTRQLGSTGLKQYSGYVREEFLREFQGQQKYKTLRQMSENDAVVGALLFLIQTLIKQVTFYAAPVNKTPEAVEDSEFLQDVLDNLDVTWSDTLDEITSFLIYGFSFHEIVYKKREDGRLGWSKLMNLAQDTLVKWEFDDDGNLTHFVQQDPVRGHQTPIPYDKALLFRTSAFKNNPEGRSILRNAYVSWYYKNNIQSIEAIGIERDLAGLPVMKVPMRIMSESANDDEAAVYAECKNIIQNVRRDEQEGVIMPSDVDAETKVPEFELSLLSTGGARNFDTNAIIDRYDRRILMSTMADFLLLGHEGVGSFALSSDKTSLFATAIGSFLMKIADVFNARAIPKLFNINGVVREKYPQMLHTDLEKVNIKELSEAISTLTGAGMELFPDDNLDGHIREIAGLPERMEGTDDLPRGTEPGDEDDLDDELEQERQQLLDAVNE